jgi:exportin-7
MRLDAELIRRVLQLIELVGQRLDAVAGGAALSPLYRCEPRLELALLFFVQRIQVGFLSEAHGMPQPQKLSGAAQRGKGGDPAASGGAAATDSTFLVPSANPQATSFGEGSTDGGTGSLGLTFGGSVSEGATHALSLISRLAGTSGLAASVEASGTNNLLGGMLNSYNNRSLTSKQTKFLELWRMVGKGDHTEVVATLISHMALCLRYWGDVDDVLKRSLAVLESMAFSYTAGRLLNSLKGVDFLLLNHGSANFPFLALPDNGRARTRFYMCLARLLFLGEDADERFEAFFAPIAATLDAAKAPGAVTARTAAVGQGLAGLGRDLRGIARAAHNRASYSLLFDSVMADGRMKAITQGIASWSDVPAVVNPLLKFVVELTTNRGSRISFPSSSPNGVMLFKTVSEAVVAHAKAVMSRPVPADDRYAARYKGISQAIKALSLSLSSGYCPLGVFALYRDAALDHSLEAGLRLVQGMSHEDIHEHTKVAKEVFSFLAVAFHSHLDKLVLLDPPTFNGLLRHLRDGVNSLNDGVAGSSAAAIDNLCTSFVRGSRRARPETAGLNKHLSVQPKIFEEIMKLLFQIVVFSEASMWTIARPLLAATLAACMVRPEAWNEFTATLVGTQAGAVKPRLASDLDKLMKGITKSLDAPNRERFTRAVHIFRVDALSYVTL